MLSSSHNFGNSDNDDDADTGVSTSAISMCSKDQEVPSFAVVSQTVQRQCRQNKSFVQEIQRER